MVVKKLVFLLLVVVTSTAWAQEESKKVSRPNIPGVFILDLGVNRGLSKPDLFKQGFWGSRTLNLYYQYPIRIGKSKFSLSPAVGFSMERFKFTNRAVLYDAIETTSPIEQYNFVAGSTLFPNVKKSMLVANYLEAPVEFRYDTRPNDRARSFSVALGGRIGVLASSTMKVKYRKDGHNEIFKDKQPYGLNPIRYGVYARLGIGGFNWFAFYNLSEMFEKDKGPSGTTMNSMTLGISIASF